MKIAVHKTAEKRYNTFADKWLEEMQSRGIDGVELDFRAPDLICKVRECDGAMWHWSHQPGDKQSSPKILNAVEFGLGIPVFPDYRTRWHYDEKVSQHYLLDGIDAPKVPSWVFWDFDEAMEFVGKCSYPIVFKLSVGAGSSNVLKLDNRSQAEKIVRKMFNEGFYPYTVNEFVPKLIPRNRREVERIKNRIVQGLKYTVNEECLPVPHYFLIQKNYAYFQAFMPDNLHDVRITVIGNRAFGFIRENRPGDFRASGSGRIISEPENIPMEAVTTALKVSAKCGFQSMAYDFLRSPEGEYVINEISYCFSSKAVWDCPGHWDSDLNWHQGQLWPQVAQLDDFLETIVRRK